MAKEEVWKRMKKQNTLQYDFCPPKEWDTSRLLQENNKVADILNSLMYSDDIEWAEIAKKLPNELIEILIAEINSGNQILEISTGSWPNTGSVVVRLRNRFSKVSRNYSPKSLWRKLDDPHYCLEEIAQVDNSVEHLIIV